VGNLNTGILGGELPFLGSNNPNVISSGFNNTGVGDSGFGNTGNVVSGVNNAFTGGVVNGFGSGYFNTASGGLLGDGFTSGFVNRGVTGTVPFLGLPSGFVSGLISGAGNMGTLISGVLNLGPR
jgi:hypothetical protein